MINSCRNKSRNNIQQIASFHSIVYSRRKTKGETVGTHLISKRKEMPHQFEAKERKSFEMGKVWLLFCRSAEVKWPILRCADELRPKTGRKVEGEGCSEKDKQGQLFYFSPAFLDSFSPHFPCPNSCVPPSLALNLFPPEEVHQEVTHQLVLCALSCPPLATVTVISVKILKETRQQPECAAFVSSEMTRNRERSVQFTARESWIRGLKMKTRRV